MPLDQTTIDAINKSLGPPGAGGPIPASQGVPALPAEARDAAGNIVVPQTAPQMAPADTAPAIVPFKYKLRPGVNDTNMDPRLVERANRLYDLIPEGLRDSAEITAARRSHEQQAAAYERFMAGVGGLAAKPGQSQHEEEPGHLPAAFDLSSGKALTWLSTAEGKRALASVGLAAPFGGKGDPGHIQLSEAGARSAQVSETKTADQRRLDPDKIAAINTSLADTGPTTTSPSTMEALGAGLIAESEEAPKFVEHSKPFLGGVAYGIAEFPLGVVQGTQVPMGAVEQKMEQFRTQFDNDEEERTAFAIGRMAGSVGSILAGSGVMGSAKLAAIMPRAVTAVTAGMGAIGRTVATGLGFGATQFYDQPEEEARPLGVPARAFDATVGGLLGVAGATVVRGVRYAADQLAKTTLGATFLPVLRQTAGATTQAAVEPLGEALDRYGRATAIGRSRYSLKDAAGREFEGFESGVGDGPEGFAQALEPYLARAKPREGQSVATRREVEGVAGRVREILGLDGEEARQAAAEKAQERWEKEYMTGVPPSARRQAEATAPPPPPPFEPRPVAADMYSQARTEINDRLWRSKNAAARAQLGAMLRDIDAVAAEGVGVDASQREAFLRKAEAASKWYRDNVVPLREFFGGKTHSEVLREMQGGSLSQMTPAKFNDKIIHIIEGGDTKQVELLGQMLGVKGRARMTELAMARALQGVQDGESKPALKYIQKHDEILRKLLGRDEYTQLVGLGKVADEVSEWMQSKRADKWKNVFDWSHSLGPAFIFYKLAEGHFAMAARIALALPAYHLATNLVHRVHALPVIRPLVRSAAGMRPGSKELDDLIGSIERRVRGAVAVGAHSAP